MAIGIYFHPEALTAALYDEVVRRLEEAGSGEPPGRLHHSCFGPADQLMVYEVWDSAESFQAFGETLMPILGDVGVKAGEPDIMPVHNVIG